MGQKKGTKNILAHGILKDLVNNSILFLPSPLVHKRKQLCSIFLILGSSSVLMT
jgi:hypothetical protein